MLFIHFLFISWGIIEDHGKTSEFRGFRGDQELRVYSLPNVIKYSLSKTI